MGYGTGELPARRGSTSSSVWIFLYEKNMRVGGGKLAVVMTAANGDRYTYLLREVVIELVNNTT